MPDIGVHFTFVVDYNFLDLPNTHVPSDKEIEQAVYKLMRNTSHDIEDIELNLTVDEDEGEL
tara:strand:+ start:270 stop:455 length:186 start_codon:yes stop_codon:yes gene_type:complete